jgi:hypothetical protein
LLFTLLLGACTAPDETASTTGAGGGNIPRPDAAAPVCAYGQTVCEGNVAKTCDGQGGFASTTVCDAECKDGLGCVQCVPNASSCASGMAIVCDATGTNESKFACEGAGMACDADGCHGECSPVSLGMGYQGCDFLPTVTANSVWGDRARVSDTGGFHFGIVIGNVSSTSSTEIRITGPTSERVFTLLAGEARTESLDWILDLKGPDWEVPYQPGSPTQSIKKASGAYRVRSDRPIIVYQFNSLENEIRNTRGCPVVSGVSANCYAYSSDGSLLLPVHALSSKYVVAGFHAWHKDLATQPGPTTGRLNMGDFISIAAPQANTEVTIKLRPGQEVLSGAPDLPRFNPGESTTFTLGERQVAQLFTPGTSDSDTFSGTEINTKDNKPVQVLSGVGCVNIFDDDSPCGHIEDFVLPFETLGKDYVVPMLTSGAAGDAGAPIRQKIRIHAITDGTAITFEPKLHNAVTLSSGEVHEPPNVTTDLRISSTTPFAVTQYVTGRTGASRSSDNLGSPNQLTVAPVSQFRTSYAFIASPQFGTNYLTVMAPTGAAVSLDNQPVLAEKFLAVGASGMSVARVPVTGGNRVHTVNADKPVGIVLFGVGPYSSYALTGGLDLKRAGTPR